MLREQDIYEFFAGRDLDIRKSGDPAVPKSGNARWIDQKCAADVISIIADCIANHVSTAAAAQEQAMNSANQAELGDAAADVPPLLTTMSGSGAAVVSPESIEFSSRDIWFSNYTVTYVQDIFKKPELGESTARHEYDKFFMQPMEMLSYAGVLNKKKVKGKNIYSVANAQVLEYLSQRERNALIFLQIYIQKVLTDSGLWDVFDTFYTEQTTEAYKAAKLAFSTFTKENTPINGDTECNRIFIKVLNPIAYARNSKGTERGHLSANKITYDMLMYNRTNFRDAYYDKAKDITRTELESALNDPNHPYHGLYSYKVNKAKTEAKKAKDQLREFVKRVYNGMSEHREPNHIHDLATHMHHIFPEAQYPDISSYLENLIALTPTQHLNYAHPNGATSEINKEYQYHLLISKAERIKENIERPSDVYEVIYDFHRFVFVLSVGFDMDELNNEIPSLDWPAVASAINSYYSKSGPDADPAPSLYQSYNPQ